MGLHSDPQQIRLVVPQLREPVSIPLVALLALFAFLAYPAWQRSFSYHLEIVITFHKTQGAQQGDVALDTHTIL